MVFKCHVYLFWYITAYQLLQVTNNDQMIVCCLKLVYYSVVIHIALIMPGVRSSNNAWGT